MTSGDYDRVNAVQPECAEVLHAGQVENHLLAVTAQDSSQGFGQRLDGGGVDLAVHRQHRVLDGVLGVHRQLGWPARRGRLVSALPIAVHEAGVGGFSGWAVATGARISAAAERNTPTNARALEQPVRSHGLDTQRMACTVRARPHRVVVIQQPGDRFRPATCTPEPV